MTRDEDEGRIGNNRSGAPDEIEPVDFRHVVVGHHNARLELGECVQGVGRAIENVDVALDVVLQQLGQQIGVRFFIIDDYYVFAWGGVHRFEWGRG